MIPGDLTWWPTAQIPPWRAELKQVFHKRLTSHWFEAQLSMPGAFLPTPPWGCAKEGLIILSSQDQSLSQACQPCQGWGTVLFTHQELLLQCLPKWKKAYHICVSQEAWVVCHRSSDFWEAQSLSVTLAQTPQREVERSVPLLPDELLTLNDRSEDLLKTEGVASRIRDDLKNPGQLGENTLLHNSGAKSSHQ